MGIGVRPLFARLSSVARINNAWAFCRKKNRATLACCNNTTVVYNLLGLLIREATVKNITLSAEEDLIESAREQARKRRTTLNAEFRRWLEQYAGGTDDGRSRVASFRSLMEDLSDVSTGGATFSRDELNAR